MRQLIPALLWFSAIGCGLMGGLYFAFSTFIMTAFSRIPAAAGISAMNSINVEIVRSLFMLFFFGTTLAAAALAGVALFRWSEPGSVAMFAGGIAYFLGMFVVTLAFNVPLNNSLAAVDPASAEGAATWATYLRDWTLWNHVRTVTSLLAAALFTAALVAR